MNAHKPKVIKLIIFFNSKDKKNQGHVIYLKQLLGLSAGMCTKSSEPRPRRDVAASETLAETLKLRTLSRVSGASTSRRDVFRDVW